ncbi:MAG: anion permease [Tissierellia bacterium]|nr:anion permease [Tissierellia bacterium]
MTLEFSEFISLLFQSPLYLIGTVVVVLAIFVGGWMDSAATIVTVVSTRTLHRRWAVSMAAVSNFFGVLCITVFNSQIINYLYSFIAFPQDQGLSRVVLLSSLITFLLWAPINWLLGVPASESHGIFSGLLGSVAALNMRERLGSNPHALPMMVGFVLTPVLTGALTVIILKILRRSLAPKERGDWDPRLRESHIFFLGGTSFIHGARNGQKYVAALYLALQGTVAASGVFVIPLWLMILVALVLSFGTFVGSRRIVRNLGQRITKITLPMGIAIESASFINLILGGILGVPMSTNQTKISAIIAAGAEGGVKRVNWRKVVGIVLLWILSFPICWGLGYLLTKVFLAIGVGGAL